MRFCFSHFLLTDIKRRRVGYSAVTHCFVQMSRAVCTVHVCVSVVNPSFPHAAVPLWRKLWLSLSQPLHLSASLALSLSLSLSQPLSLSASLCQPLFLSLSLYLSLSLCLSASLSHSLLAFLSLSLTLSAYLSQPFSFLLSWLFFRVYICLFSFHLSFTLYSLTLEVESRSLCYWSSHEPQGTSCRSNWFVSVQFTFIWFFLSG